MLIGLSSVTSETVLSCTIEVFLFPTPLFSLRLIKAIKLILLSILHEISFSLLFLAFPWWFFPESYFMFLIFPSGVTYFIPRHLFLLPVQKIVFPFIFKIQGKFNRSLFGLIISQLNFLGALIPCKRFIAFVYEWK